MQDKEIAWNRAKTVNEAATKREGGFYGAAATKKVCAFYGPAEPRGGGYYSPVEARNDLAREGQLPSQRVTNEPRIAQRMQERGVAYSQARAELLAEGGLKVERAEDQPPAVKYASELDMQAVDIEMDNYRELERWKAKEDPSYVSRERSEQETSDAMKASNGLLSQRNNR